MNNELQIRGYPSHFFSRKLSLTQQKYSAYDRELLAVYETITFFRHFLEGRSFKIYTDHKPLLYAFKQRSDKTSPRQARQLSFIAQFSAEIEYMPGPDNVLADSLSRIEALQFPVEVELVELARLQSEDNELKHLITSPNSSLKLKRFIWGSPHTESCIANCLANQSVPTFQFRLGDKFLTCSTTRNLQTRTHTSRGY